MYIYLPSVLEDTLSGNFNDTQRHLPYSLAMILQDSVDSTETDFYVRSNAASILLSGVAQPWPRLQ